MNQEQFYRIEAYLRGDMPPAERTAFEAELVADPVLAEQVAEHQVQRKVAELLVEDDLRAEISQWKKELRDEPAQQPAPGKTFRLPLWLLGGAAVALILFVYFLFLKPPPDSPGTIPPTPAPNTIPKKTTIPEQPVANQTQQDNLPPGNTTLPNSNKRQNEDGLSPQQITSPDRYYASLVKPFSEKPDYSGESLRGADASEQRLKKALALLREGKFEPAIDSLRAFQPGDKLFTDAQYNLGCAYYARQEYEKAIPFLKTASRQQDFLYASNARWYLAVSLAATGKLAESEAETVAMIETPAGGDFQTGARALQERMWSSFPSPSWEANIRGGARSEGQYKITLEEPPGDANFIPGPAGQVSFRFRGKIASAPSATLPVFALTLYTNRGMKLFEAPLTLQKETANTMRFDYRERRKMTPGLYYFTIMTKEEGQMVYAGRFTVQH